MADPTETEVKTAITNFLDICEDFRQWLYVDVKNYLGMESTFIASMRTRYGDIVLGPLYSLRARLNAALGDGAGSVAAMMLDMGKALNLPSQSILTLLEQLRVYYAENGRRVKSREFTRGTPTAAGSNVGNGAIRRLTVDEYGLPIERGFAEAITAKCVRDVSQGAAKHEEVFQWDGNAPERDRIRVTGTGTSPVNPVCMSARESMGYVGNCSWDVYQGASAAAPDEIPSWTPNSSIGNFAIDTSLYYRDYEGATAPSSLIIEGNDKLVQAFTVRRAPIVESNPYYWQVAVNRNSLGCDGTLNVTVGGITTSFTISALAASGWVICRGPETLSNWYKGFKTNAPTFEIGVTGGSVFGLRADDFIFAPYRLVKGTWIAPVGGSTKFLYRDSFAYTDSEVGAVIQYFLAYWFDAYLPASDGSPTSITWADPV